MILPQIKEQSIACAIDWLESNGLPPLPVAPKQDAHKYPAKDKQGNIVYESDGVTPKPLFNGKNPSYLDAQGIPHLVKHSKFRRKKPTQAEKDTWWANHANGIGTIAGSAGVNWIDIDYKGGTQTDRDNTVAQLLERVPRTYYEQTPSGGYHIAVKLNIPKNFTNFALSGDGPHIGEFLGKGRFVVLAPTNGYQSLNGREIASAVDPTSLGLWPTKGKTQETKALKANKPAIHIETSDNAPELIQLISKRNQEVLKGGDYDDRSAAITGFARDCYGWENFLSERGWAHAGSGADTLITQAAQSLGIEAKVSRCLEGLSRSACRPALEYAGKHRPQEYYIKLCKHKVSRPKPKENSTLAKITQIRLAYDHRVRLNLLNQKIELDHKAIEEIENEHIYYIENTGNEVGLDLFCRTLKVISKENAYNPVIEYLESLDPSASNPSIFVGIANRHFGTHDPLYDTYVMRWMISAVARAYEPGCKADCALFLQGVQGARKSSFFSVLASEPFFDNNLGDVKNNKDELQILHRAWIHEWSELENAFKKRDISEVKSFLARSVDVFRPPYGRQPIDMARRSILCGSTNQQEFLADETGERRFWIIPLKNRRINLAKVKEERDQLWATALALYRKGEQWWLTDEEEELSKALSVRFKSLDPWHDAVTNWVDGKDFVRVNDILTLGLNYELNKIGRTEQRRVSSILTVLGFRSGQKTINGKNTKVWFAPEPPLDPEPEVTPTVECEPLSHSEVESNPVPATGTQPKLETVDTLDEAIEKGVLPADIKGIDIRNWMPLLLECESFEAYANIRHAIPKDMLAILAQFLPEHKKGQFRHWWRLEDKLNGNPVLLSR